MADPQDTEAVKLARMQQQMADLVQTVGRIERKVDEVVTLDRTIVQIQSESKHQAEEMETQWKKIDSHAEEISKVDRKIDKWVNTARGAWLAVAVSGAAVQIAVAASVAWVFGNVQDLGKKTAIMEYQVKELSRYHPVAPFK